MSGLEVFPKSDFVHPRLAIGKHPSRLKGIWSFVGMPSTWLWSDYDAAFIYPS